MTSSKELVLVDTPVSGCALLTLNRPEAMNALSTALRQRFVAAVSELAADPRVRVLILTGAGRAFCAGLDLKELGASDGLGSALSRSSGEDLIDALKGFPGPIIGAINGAAITGGFEVALACDLMIASTEARFADTHGRVGVMPGWGMSQKLSRLIGISRAKELSFTGNFLSATQAEAWGLVNRVVAPEQLLPAAIALAADMLGLIPEMLVGLKRVIDDGYAGTFEQGLRMERERSVAWGKEIDPAAIESRREAVRARGRGAA